MKNFFTEEIYNWDTWGQVYQSIPAFEELVKRIFEHENLTCGKITHLAPGSNAVFRVDNYVIKIFAPIESGVNTQIDYSVEMLGMKRAMDVGIDIPNVIATSHIQDKYLFRYIIMEYVDGKEAKDVLKFYSNSKKKDFLKQLRSNLKKLNTQVDE